MIHPSYVDLMQVVNKGVEEGETPVINSRYSIVMATAKRARQIVDGDEPLIEDAEGEKPLSIAVEELNQGKIRILSENEPDEEVEEEIVFELVDSEEMLGALRERGYQFTDDENEADAAIVNTCCFIMDAQKESIEQILALAERRTEGALKALIVTGCMAQRYKDEVLREIPEVDAVIGTTSEGRIAEILDEILQKGGPAGSGGYLLVDSEDKRTGTTAERVVTTGGYYSYLKIAEGCDKRCTYCVIPSIRGRYRSVPMEQLLDQARLLASKGIRELILVAQETTLYGTDLYGHKALPELLRKLADIPEIEWIRLMYCYPEEITKEIAEAMRDIPQVLHYIDMPIQHASDEILRRMGRHTDRQELTEKIAMLREMMPDICLRTTLITGFPGEKEEDHRGGPQSASGFCQGNAVRPSWRVYLLEGRRNAGG